MKLHTQTTQKLPGVIAFGAILTGFAICNTATAGMMDEPVVTKFTVDKLEITDGEDNPIVWELDAWVLQDIQRLVIKSSGQTVKGETASENMALYGHGIAPYWDIQVGLGYDTHEDDSHTWGVVGLSGMAPYFFETDVYALVDSDGVFGFRFATEYEALITQKWVLSPEIEVEAYSDDIPELKLGSGLSSVGLGIRLRYEIKREFAPYIGVEWHKTFGNTADYHDEEFETSVVVGLRFWF